MNTAPKKKPAGCYWMAMVLLFVVLCVSVMMNFGLWLGKMARTDRAVGITGRPVDQYPKFETQWSFGDGDTVLVRIPLQGIIMRQVEGGLFMPQLDKVQILLDRIRAAENDERVRGIILEVDSPGGAVTPSDEIYHALVRFRESAEDRRVIVFTRDMAASGAYYAAMAGDWLIAEPTALVGSIGVMIQSLNWHELTDRIGLHDTTIKSGDTKDILNPFRPVNPDELGILQDLVDSMYARFANIVQEGRGFDDAALKQIADGRIFTADEALEKGMIDAIGYWDDVVEQAAEVMGVPAVRIIRYERRPSFADWFVGVRTPLDWPSALSREQSPRMLYLWSP